MMTAATLLLIRPPRFCNFWIYRNLFLAGDTGMPTSAEVITELTRLGVRKIDNFNQSGEGRAWQAGSAMADGYCHGICLDWARRVLQGGRASFGPNPERAAEEGYNFNARRQEQASRQGNAWTTYYAASERVRVSSNNSYQTAFTNYQAQFDNFQSQSNDMAGLLQQMINDYNNNSRFGESHSLQISYGQRLREFYDWAGPAGTVQVGLLGSMIDGLQAQRSALQAPAAPVQTTAAQNAQTSWTQFTQWMDRNYAKGRAFGNVSLIHLDPSRDYDSLQTAMASITRPPPQNYANGRAMVIGVEFATSGHAVATYWRANNSHYFLDPNYGMFEYRQLGGNNSVESALNYLFGTVYPASPGVTVLNRIEYGIFAQRDA
jgi:hypothetical protein